MGFIVAQKGASYNWTVSSRQFVDQRMGAVILIFTRTFQRRGDTVEILPAYEDTAIRRNFWRRGSSVLFGRPLTGEFLGELTEIDIFR